MLRLLVRRMSSHYSAVGKNAAASASASTEYPVDFRSDTVTRPTAGMLAAMTSAVLGDDVYLECPTTRRLEEELAAMAGKEAGLFVPTGVMSNQVRLALLPHLRSSVEP